MKKLKIILLLFLCTQSLKILASEISQVGNHFDHVIYIVLENKDYKDVAKHKYFKNLADRGTALEQFFAQTHPSQPNYIAMVAGSTLGVKSNTNVALNDVHLGDLLEERGLDWRLYAEDYPGNCFLGGSSGSYARKHVPFLSFKNVQNNSKRCAKVVKFEQFNEDLNNGKLSSFNMIIPNNKNNGHDTNIETSARWLEKNFQKLFNDPKKLERTLVIITYDEGIRDSSNQIYTLLLGGSLKPKTQINTKLSHYSLLRLIEDEFSLRSLNREDHNANSITGIWK